MIFHVDLPGFPDWAIPMTRIVPVVRFPSGYDIEDITKFNNFAQFNFSPNLSYRWNKKDDQNYSLTISFNPTANYLGEGAQLINIPVYIDLELVIVNDNNYYVTQTLGI